MKNWQLHKEDLLKDSEWQNLKDHLEKKMATKNWTAIQDYAIAMFAIWTGLRRSEIANINVKDLYLNEVNPYVIVRHGKGNKYREVFISQECKKFLQDYIVNRYKDGEALFIPQRGERYTGDGVYRIIKTAMHEAGMKPKSIHKMRHYYASKLWDVTKDPKFLQEQLGHSTLNTISVYAHIEAEKANQYMELLDSKI